MAGQDLETQHLDASGIEHEVPHLTRDFSLWSLCGVGLMTGVTWTTVGGSIAIALSNGGPAGVIYEYIAVSLCYWAIAACIAELASAIPSSAGVYHWASVTAGQRWSRIVSWYAGWFNALAWTFGAASISSILVSQVLSMYQLFHEGYEPQRWHLFIVYIILTWLTCGVVLFYHRGLPMIGNAGVVLILAGVLLTIMVCAIMPSQTGSGYASNDAVWKQWTNMTGYSSSGFAFCAGMLNGAYAVGTPDCVTHLAEEIPEPRKNIPKAIAVQMGVGLATGFPFLVTIFYAVNSTNQLLTTKAIFPLAEVYAQATSSRGGTLGLLLLAFIPTVCTNIGVYITCGRMLWTLARDNATPFSHLMSQISVRWHNPFNATVACGLINTVMGLIYLGSSTAFNAFVGSFVVLVTTSYLCAILPYLLSGRKHVVPGWFRLPRFVFIPLASASCAYMFVFDIIFCFPYFLPVAADSMNYTSVIVVGLAVLVSGLWAWKGRRGYEGPDVSDFCQRPSVEDGVVKTRSPRDSAQEAGHP